MSKYREIENMLRGYKKLKAQITDIQIQLEELKDMESIGISAIDYSKDRISPTFLFNSQTENEAVKMADMGTLLKARMLHAEKLIMRIDNALASLSEEENKIINVRYISNPDNRRAWYSLVEQLGMSEPTCWRILQIALEKIENILFGENLKEK